RKDPGASKANSRPAIVGGNYRRRQSAQGSAATDIRRRCQSLGELMGSVARQGQIAQVGLQQGSGSGLCARRAQSNRTSQARPGGEGRSEDGGGRHSPSGTGLLLQDRHGSAQGYQECQRQRPSESARSLAKIRSSLKAKGPQGARKRRSQTG